MRPFFVLKEYEIFYQNPFKTFDNYMGGGYHIYVGKGVRRRGIKKVGTWYLLGYLGSRFGCDRIEIEMINNNRRKRKYCEEV